MTIVEPVRRTVEERVALGREARKKAPRQSHAEWSPPEGRDPIGLLEEQATSRVPELVPLRHSRMLASPFAFFRGGALIMAADLARSPTSGLQVQVCGDAHLSNFGLFGSPERELVFDINDFDETLPGPWEWDVKRLAASIEIAGRANGFAEPECRKAVLDTVAGYRGSMHDMAAMNNLDVWYLLAKVQEGLPRASAVLDKADLKALRRVIKKALSRDNRQALSKLTVQVDGGRELAEDPPLVLPIRHLLKPELVEPFQDAMDELMGAYMQSLPDDRAHLLEGYEIVDLARKVVGVGSVGTRAWIVLLKGRDEDDALLIQVKEAQASVLERYVGESAYEQHGQRVVEGQRLMQATSDIFLGWVRTRADRSLDGVSYDYYLRQLRDWKGSWEPSTMSPTGMAVYGQLCAWTLARAHARSGDRIAIASYLGKSDTFDRAIADFAVTYADQNDKDHEALADAVASGRLEAAPES